MYSTETKLEINVSHLQHGLSRVDNILGGVREDVLMLVDYKQKRVAVCYTNLSTENKLSFLVKNVLEMEIPACGLVQHCGLLDRTIYTFMNSCFYSAQKSLDSLHDTLFRQKTRNPNSF